VPHGNSYADATCDADDCANEYTHSDVHVDALRRHLPHSSSCHAYVHTANGTRDSARRPPFTDSPGRDDVKR
jgi:hypothetical protein